MYILGLNSVYHESSAAIVYNGELLAAVEEERFNRIKHAKPAEIDTVTNLPYQAIDYCLKMAGITFDQIDAIGYSFEPEVRLEKNVGVDKYLTEGDFGDEKAERAFYDANMKVVPILEEHYGVSLEGKFHYLSHHICHLGSAFFVSPFENAALLCVDGISEFESTTLAVGRGNKIEMIKRLGYPDSLGFLWEKFSEYVGFSEYDACKVMGLASYGTPDDYREAIRKIVTVDDDGTFHVDNDLIQFRSGNFKHLEEIFGVAKRNSGDELEQKHQDIASALQELTEEIMTKLAAHLCKTTGISNLAIAGGVGLNCVANGKIAELPEVDDLWIQPGANDAGTSIGAAFLIWNQMFDNPRSFVMDHAFFGPEFEREEIEPVLKEYGLDFEYTKELAKDTAQLLTEGAIVAWFQGRMEFGPRALGARSLIADPRKREMMDVLNVRIKHREKFRPFCPSVLKEKTDEYFKGKSITARNYMLAAVDVISDKIPAVTHVDGTARVQEVEAHTNPRYHELLTEFEKLTGVAVLLNTSLNDQEPIVCSPTDAVKTFLKTDMDYLVIGDFIASKTAEQRAAINS